MSASLLDHFGPLEDPLIDRNKRHALLDILVLVVSAVCSNAKGWEAIEDFGHAKLDWLRQFVPLENGVPSHDCIEYVMVRLSPVKFRECFMNWTQAVRQEIDEVIAVDGKTARGSRDRANNGNPLHRVTAWACQNRLVLAPEATDEKSNEITAIPKLLELLELKGNQSSLHEAVDDYFTTARQHAFKSVPHAYAEETDKDHGRLEIRRYWITEDLSTLPKVDLWTGLRSIGMVERECTQGGNTTVERRFFIASIPADAKRFAKAVREHWGLRTSCTGGWMSPYRKMPAVSAKVMAQP